MPMMVAKALLMSYLAQQRALLQRERFVDRYRHDWLVWEPGNWVAARPGMHSTLVPRTAATSPAKGDALCFELAPPPPGKPLIVGRAEDCAIVLNDATVSREHLFLTLSDDGWWATVASSSQGARLNGKRVAPGARVQLLNDVLLGLGEAVLTFCTHQGFARRVEQEAARM